jgi:hypothetical protein
MCLILALWGGSVAHAQDAGDPPDSQSPAKAQPYIPMTAQERWHAYVQDNFTSPGVVAGFFGAAAIGQLGREPREWGLGAQGYWHRVGNHMGRAAIRGSIQSGLAAALRYDTRYHRMAGHNGLARTGHALRRTLFTQNEAGHSVIDLPGLAGVYGSDMLATYWHPRRYTPFGRGVQAANFGLGFQAAGNLAKEFGPDLKHLLLRK